MLKREDILELLKYGERITLECKDSRNEISKSVWETYSAFANTCGGTILLGIEEHMSETNIQKRFSFTDVKNPEVRLKEFWDTINSNKVYLLQSGAYSSIDNMKMNTKQLNYVYFNDEGMYKTIVAITKNKDNIKKIKNAYNIDMVINEYYLENDDLINKINEYDKELAGTSDKEEVVKIVNNMLINYKEENNIKLVKTY